MDIELSDKINEGYDTLCCLRMVIANYENALHQAEKVNRTGTANDITLSIIRLAKYNELQNVRKLI